MNLQLLNPHETASCPESMESQFDIGCALTCAFNRRGTLIAVGCAGGEVIIWDFGTKGVVRRLMEHVRPVTSVGWTKNGRKLLSSSADRTIKLWDIESGSCDNTVTFPSSVINAQLHPSGGQWCVVSEHMTAAVLIDLSKNDKEAYESRQPLLPDTQLSEGVVAPAATKGKAGAMLQAVAAIAFDKDGKRVLLGDDHGVVSVINFEIAADGSSVELTLEATITAIKNQPIKAINFSRPGHHFLVVAGAQIQLYDASSLELQRSFEDKVNSTKWRCSCFSGDAYYVIGGSATMAAHSISIWDATTGHLERILEGPKEGILDLQWHPSMPVICSVSTLGVVYVWGKQYTENWSAFAPDFTELEENEEYIEAEDEFDIIACEDRSDVKQQIEDEEVDVLATERLLEDDSDDELAFLPAVPDDGPQGELEGSGRVDSKNDQTEKHNCEMFAEEDASKRTKHNVD